MKRDRLFEKSTLSCCPLLSPFSKCSFRLFLLVSLAALVFPACSASADPIEDPGTLKVRLMQAVGLYHQAPQAQRS